ncbi:hypothetical protein K502DRAFT_323716 [Neoconidiobolus thromboides FSU 785]|nr:hypothetical protein K502DRAFT_323716 [Neoconidiobolus thromboides FSU 785]
MKTCCVECVKTHKARNKCSGKKANFEFLPKAKLDENSLLNDYKYLTEVTRIAENSERELHHKAEFKNTNYNKKLNLLNKKLESFNIKAMSLSKGMLKAKLNRSFWCYRENTSFWTITWKLIINDKMDIEVVTHYNKGIETLDELFESKIRSKVNSSKNSDDIKMLKSVKEHPCSSILTQSIELYYFISKINTNAKTPTFYQLDSDTPLQQALSHIRFYEFPTIHVYHEMPDNLNISPILPVNDSSPKLKSIGLTNDDSDIEALERDLNIKPKPNNNSKVPKYNDYDKIEVDKVVDIIKDIPEVISEDEPDNNQANGPDENPDEIEL